MRKGKAISLLIVLGVGVFFYSGTFLDISRSELQQKYATESSNFLKTSDGKIIHYKDEGNPSLPTIVFLHGFNGSLFNFERLIPLLDNEFRLMLLISLNKLSTPISSGSKASTVLSTCLNTRLKFPSSVTV